MISVLFIGKKSTFVDTTVVVQLQALQKLLTYLIAEF